MKLIKIAKSPEVILSKDFSNIKYYYENYGSDSNDINCNDDIVKQLIIDSFKNIYGGSFENLARRYKFNVTDAHEDYTGATFNVSFSPLGSGEEELTSEDRPGFEYDNEFRDGKTGYVLYKNPKQAISDIPVDNSLMYRGMSWEEWRSINKSGKIVSKGEMNIEQEGLTFFSVRPSSATSYASGFTPMQYEISYKTPGVVIAVPIKYGLSGEDRKDIPESERAIKGALPASEIVHVWFLIPVKEKTSSKFDIEIPSQKVTRYEENNKILGWKLSPENARTGSGVFSLSTRYKLIQKL